jgi:hypothetical protein
MKDKLKQLENLAKTRGNEIQNEYREIGKMKQKIHEKSNKWK